MKPKQADQGTAKLSGGTQARLIMSAHDNNAFF